MEFVRRTWAEIDTAALLHNFNAFKKWADGRGIMAVVKANAYGHSASFVAPLLESNGADSFAVSNIDEAISLREYGIKKPILILGYTPVNCVNELYRYDIIQAVFSLEYAKLLSNEAQKNDLPVKIHIKLDTGMGRIGFDCRDESFKGIDEAVSAARLENLIFRGIFTHFAVSDRSEESEDGFTDMQYSRFTKAVSLFEKAGLNPPFCHCCNSAAFLNDKDKHLSLCRLGIILYGLTPSDELTLNQTLIPVMTVKSVVSMVKDIKPDDTISYGRTFTAQKNMRIATVSAGYADGYPRLLSSKGSVIIRGKRAPIVGRICMDQFCVDVTDIEDVAPDDEVILFGKELPVEELARLTGTINYEIVCGISSRVPRIIV